MFLVEGTNSTKAFDDKDINEQFIKFLSSVFSERKLSSEASDYTLTELNFLRFGEKESQKVLISPEARKACGHDIGNIILKNA